MICLKLEEIWGSIRSRTWISCFPLLCFNYKHITPPTDMSKRSNVCIFELISLSHRNALNTALGEGPKYHRANLSFSPAADTNCGFFPIPWMEIRQPGFFVKDECGSRVL